jgi:hypothetical protein
LCFYVHAQVLQENSSHWIIKLKVANTELYLSMALQPFFWTFAAFSVSWSFTQSIGLLVRGSARPKASTCTQDSTNTE